MNDITCPHCSRSGGIKVNEVASDNGNKDNKLLICSECTHVFVEEIDPSVPGRIKLVDITPALERFRLGDDKVRAALSPIHVRTLENFHQMSYRHQMGIRDQLDGLVAESNVLMYQIENRVRFLHSKLAEMAMVNAAAVPLLETAQQLLDLVSGKPDGVKASSGSATG